MQALGFTLQYGCFGYVVEADIQGFFSHLDHDWLKRMLRERIADASFIGLIGQWLKAGVMEPDGSFLYPEAGTPPGGVVSPILANIYLHHGLDLWFEGVVKPHCRGQAMLIRYADDFVCAFRYREDAEAFSGGWRSLTSRWRLRRRGSCDSADSIQGCGADLRFSGSSSTGAWTTKASGV